MQLGFKGEKLMILNKKAQTFLDYGMIIVVVTAALLIMDIYIRRSIQAHFKMFEDQVNYEIGITPIKGS